MKRIAFCLVFAALLTAALTAEDDALAIVRRVDAKQHSATSRMEMIMTTYPNLAIESDKREFVVLSYSRGDDENYNEFLEPRSIRGLRILGKGDDNWVYFPSTGRTRKIAGKSKKESVQGVGGVTWSTPSSVRTPMSLACLSARRWR
ncbi:MAG: outer membrane lipoprotein-sorting protein [Candidatus Competibacteraceae bacterium]|nr:outer membrane lipoprotein-sorting protein [Candidatus Competibacteraceae bacterium]